MVPSDEIIRQKVRAIEAQPVAWDKSGAWEKINRHVSPTKKFPYIAIAASLTLTLLFSGHDWNASQNNPPAFSNVLAEKALLPGGDVDDCKSSAVRHAQSKKIIHTPPALALEQAMEDTTSLKSGEAVVLADLPRLDTLVLEIAENPQAVISPLLGVIPQEAAEPERRIRDRKKMKMNFFHQGQDSKFPQAPDSKLIVARIR
jgi:hypothetical protein